MAPHLNSFSAITDAKALWPKRANLEESLLFACISLQFCLHRTHHGSSNTVMDSNAPVMCESQCGPANEAWAWWPKWCGRHPHEQPLLLQGEGTSLQTPGLLHSFLAVPQVWSSADPDESKEACCQVEDLLALGRS